jgi:twinfilin-like protein
MLYSSGVSSTYATGKNILAALPSPVQMASRKIETASPEELNEAYLRDELGLSRPPRNAEGLTGNKADAQEKMPFAKPRGPGRRR